MKNAILNGILLAILFSGIFDMIPAHAQTIQYNNLGGGFMNVSKSFVSNLANQSGQSPKVQNALSSAIDTISKLWDFTQSAKNTTVNTITAVAPIPLNTTILGWLGLALTVGLVLLLIWKTIKWILIFVGIALAVIIALMILGINVQA